MIKTYLLSALLFGSTALTAAAADGKINVLYLDGQAHEVAMSAVAKLEVSGSDIVLIGKDGNTVATHAIADIDKIGLISAAAGINQTKAAKTIKVRSNGYTITAEGMTDGKLLEVYTASGKLAGKAVAHGGKATIDAAGLTQGVYIVKAEGQSLKLVKQ